MLQIQNLNYSIGERPLLKDVSWTIHPGQRLALIGPNGAGKTTLLRIIAGELEPDRMDIVKPKEYSIGYLPQEELALEHGTVLETAVEGHGEIIRLQEEIDRIHKELDSGNSGNEKLLYQLGKLEDIFRSRGGYELEFKAKKILSGLGFTEADFDRPLRDMSGGWRMRAYLARLLLINPSLLLLDEPTNHLDIPSLEWIEDYLRDFAGSMIIVSHDRFFVDRLAQKIGELENGRLTHYGGNYHFYEKQKALNREQLLKKCEEQREERQRLQRFIDRFRYKATKAAQVQSRIKMLEKMEKIEIPEQTATVRFAIKAASPSYKDVLSIEKMFFRYDRQWVLEDINLKIYRGERLALVGINGAGKTTLTRLINSELQPQTGALKLGQNVITGYYAQHQIDALNLNNTVMKEVEETAAPAYISSLRNILGVFRFSGDDVNKRIGVLSGGEKARVSLAKILLSPCNFLIMDEPTNHLDLASREALESALEHYDGTLLLISHDRYFLDKLVHRVVEIKDHHIKVYEGNYSGYLAKRAVLPVVKEEISKNEIPGTTTVKKTKDQKQKEALARQAVSSERNKLNKEITILEEQIHALETEKKALETSLADPAVYSDPENAVPLNRRYQQVCQELPELEARWEFAHEQLEALLIKLSLE
ncbi:MAG: ATP-binding cassette domain-containing protein [Calditrichaceae bacterium]|nr:ATP-binding cassette domain-containing protein [Calditrichaceae bacterium]MBN2708999.1 ATP-binding cassette domain-containing protein [Calditrichaceae bacterium]RQV95347.1 MAG: ATP-binding cassette domain-containing protein [Calditrichota bacterium]